MKVVKWIVLGFSLIVVGMGLAAKLSSFGGQGLFTLVMGLLPALLVGAAIGLGRPFGRLFAGLSLVAFLIVGMKTSSSEDLENIMMVAFAGMIASLIPLIRPERLGAVVRTQGAPQP